MTLWLVRAGKYGQNEQAALDQGFVTIGWDSLSNLKSFKTKEALKEKYQELRPDAKKMKIANHAGQIWAFAQSIQKGDLVALPLKRRSGIAIGTIEGDYEYRPEANQKHIRKVKWIDVYPRSKFPQDILYSFGAFMSVCQITRNDAEARVKKIIKHKGPPSEEVSTVDTATESIDVEQYAKDQLVKHIEANFKGHGLAIIVDAILKAQGYTTQVSPPGPDGGIDILASKGSLGFEEPHVCVQVKSSVASLDVRIVRELQGVMQRIKAKNGLVVAWGGLNSKALEEAKHDFFVIRIWDQASLLEQIFKYYDKFDDELKADLPLKRIWTLVDED